MADLQEPCRSDRQEPGAAALGAPEPQGTAESPVRHGTSEDGAQDADPDRVREFALERYRYILQQIHTLNENVYRFLALYQALATAVVGATLALFVGYKSWGLDAATARSGMIALMSLNTVIAGFSVMLIIIGVIAWIDYRQEECELTDKIVHPGFRAKPKLGNLFRWYETYIVAFIVTSTAFAWLGTVRLLLPTVK